MRVGRVTFICFAEIKPIAFHGRDFLSAPLRRDGRNIV